MLHKNDPEQWQYPPLRAGSLQPQTKQQTTISGWVVESPRRRVRTIAKIESTETAQVAEPEADNTEVQAFQVVDPEASDRDAWKMAVIKQVQRLSVVVKKSRQQPGRWLPTLSQTWMRRWPGKHTTRQGRTRRWGGSRKRWSRWMDRSDPSAGTEDGWTGPSDPPASTGCWTGPLGWLELSGSIYLSI